MKKFLLLSVIFFTLSGNVYTQSPQNVLKENGFDAKLQQKIKNFEQGDITRLDEYLAKFTDSELLQVWQDFIANKPLTEKRYYQIFTSYSERLADQKASSRLFYLFLALILLFVLILTLCLIIYRQQQRLSDEVKER